MMRQRLTVFLAAAAAIGGAAHLAAAQSATRAVFVPHYFPVNSVSPVGATIACFRINADDTATFVEGEVSGEWTQSIALSPNGRWLVCASGTSSATTEEMRVFRVESDASLTPVLVTSTPDSPLDMTWVTDSVLAVTRTQTGGSSILTYRWDDQAMTMTPADSEPSGYFNSAVVRHPSQPWIYTQDSGVFGGIPQIQQWLVAPDGALTSLGSFSSIDPPLKPSISPDGRWMFSGTGAFGFNTVAVFSLDPVTGAGAEVVGSPFFSDGDTPYRTDASEDGRYLFVGHTVDDTVRTFTIDQNTGALTATGAWIDIGPRGSLGPLARLGNLLIVLKDSNDPIGMLVFRIEESGSITQVGPLYSTMNRRPELAVAVWNPPASPACPADIDGNGTVTLQDLFEFLGLWFAGDLAADFDDSGSVSLQDVFEFLSAWFEPCP